MQEQSRLAAVQAEELNEQIRADAFRQQREREQAQRQGGRRRARAISDATEIPGSPTFQFDEDEDGDGDDEGDDDVDADADGDGVWSVGGREVRTAGGDPNVEFFGKELEWDGVRFDRVRLFHPRQGMPN